MVQPSTPANNPNLTTAIFLNAASKMKDLKGSESWNTLNDAVNAMVKSVNTQRATVGTTASADASKLQLSKAALSPSPEFIQKCIEKVQGYRTKTNEHQKHNIKRSKGILKFSPSYKKIKTETETATINLNKLENILKQIQTKKELQDKELQDIVKRLLTAESKKQDEDDLYYTELSSASAPSTVKIPKQLVVDMPRLSSKDTERNFYIEVEKISTRETEEKSDGKSEVMETSSTENFITSLTEKGFSNKKIHSVSHYCFQRVFGNAQVMAQHLIGKANPNAELLHLQSPEGYIKNRVFS
jgi:hypothetical protein